ncbi:hypothetical protein AAF712_011798 [Marasmius tenuissimus]|uniref:Uncharacterized protein n=1 Tax=Marasmius tenuissimus TaxID=585030 RepID=A0ABR2ZIB8_9AGAR
MSLNDPQYRLWFDYIEYTPTNSATDAAPELNASSNVPPASSVAPDGATATNKPRSSVDNKRISTGLAVGVSVTAATLTVLIVIGLWWLRRRKRMKQALEEPASSFTYLSGPNTMAPMVQRGFRHSQVQPYPLTMSPTGGSGRTRMQYIPYQYSSATSASGTDQEQPQDIESELPPYRKIA